MTAVSNELIYEVLKAVQARLGNFDDQLRDMRGQLAAIRVNQSAIQQQLSAVQHDVANLYDVNGVIDGRLSRIERRLEIIDTPSNSSS
jgi:septal ring factor EnvC (AmiA/AmiB activator)